MADLDPLNVKLSLKVGMPRGWVLHTWLHESKRQIMESTFLVRTLRPFPASTIACSSIDGKVLNSLDKVRV